MTTPRWRPEPIAVPSPGSAPVPEVRLLEVGPRDGLQAEPAVVPTEVKAEFCRRLAAAGARRIEVTSFVSPKWVPQLGDAEALLADLDLGEAVTASALVLNARGLERARAAGVADLAVFASATESFARANANTGRDELLATATGLAAQAPGAVRGYLSMAFGDPWEGPVPVERVAMLAARLYDGGCSVVALGDTIGVGTPGQVEAVVDAVVAAGVPVSALAMHFHDTYGMGLANVRAALDRGVREFDAAAGGIGRCPYAPGATGNLGTEDLVWMLEGLGIRTGLDLDALVATSVWMAQQLGSERIASRVATALAAAGAVGA